MASVKTLKTTLKTLDTSKVKTLEHKAGATPRMRGSGWMKAREVVFKRDRMQCRACDAPLLPNQGQVDHVIPLEQGGSNGPENLQLLCVNCHDEKTKRENKARFGIL
jgi:5-methylcytosine-specific restriction endonuclease McrA